MSGVPGEPRDDDRDRVELEIYGLKATTRAGDLGEPQPTTMREALRQMRGHLLRILVAPTRLVAELFEGATRLVRGTSTLPSAIAMRVQAAHARADHGEDQRQEAAEAGGPKRLLPNALAAERAAEIRRLEAWFAKVRGRLHDGAPVEAGLVDVGEGRMLAVAGVSSAQRPVAEATAANAMRRLASGGREPELTGACLDVLAHIAMVEPPYVVELTGTLEQIGRETVLRDLAQLGYVSLVDVSLGEQVPEMAPFIGATLTSGGSLLVRELAAGRTLAEARAIAASAFSRQPELAAPE